MTLQTRLLTADEVVLIHEDQIERYVGLSGLRDVALLESAVAQPAATFCCLPGSLAKLRQVGLREFARLSCILPAG